MSIAKQYSCPRYGKRTKSTSGLTRHLNVCTKEIPRTAHLQKLHDDPVDTSDGNLEEGSQLLGETNYTIRDVTDLPTEKTPQDGLLASVSLSSLREEWFTGNKFPASTPVSDIKYNYPGLKYQNSFYSFND